MVSNNYYYLMTIIICFHRITFLVFLPNINNLNPITGFYVFLCNTKGFEIDLLYSIIIIIMSCS